MISRWLGDGIQAGTARWYGPTLVFLEPNDFAQYLRSRSATELECAAIAWAVNEKG